LFRLLLLVLLIGSDWFEDDLKGPESKLKRGDRSEETGGRRNEHEVKKI
jgi:hypothetical protein